MVFRQGARVFYAAAFALTSASLALLPMAVCAQGSPVPGQGSYAGGPNGYPGGQSTYPGGAGAAPAPGAPVPGAGAGSAYSATPYAGSSGYSTSLPRGQNSKSAYSKLPLNGDDAKVRIAELRNMLAVSRPQDVQESVFQLCEWLSDMADAHWKLSLALAKNDSMKAAAAQERASAVKFSSLKHEAALLKAELFIKQNRLPEALGPLVDIVVAEPKSTIGQAAYEKLKEIGFAEQAGDAGYQPADKNIEKAPVLVPVTSQSKPPVLVPVASQTKAPVLVPVAPQLKAVQSKPAPVAQVPKAGRAAQAAKTR